MSMTNWRRGKIQQPHDAKLYDLCHVTMTNVSQRKWSPWASLPSLPGTQLDYTPSAVCCLCCLYYRNKNVAIYVNVTIQCSVPIAGASETISVLLFYLVTSLYYRKKRNGETKKGNWREINWNLWSFPLSRRLRPKKGLTKEFLNKYIWWPECIWHGDASFKMFYHWWWWPGLTLLNCPLPTWPGRQPLSPGRDVMTAYHRHETCFYFWNIRSRTEQGTGIWQFRAYSARRLRVFRKDLPAKLKRPRMTQNKAKTRKKKNKRLRIEKVNIRTQTR